MKVEALLFSRLSFMQSQTVEPTAPISGSATPPHKSITAIQALTLGEEWDKQLIMYVLYLEKPALLTICCRADDICSVSMEFPVGAFRSLSIISARHVDFYSVVMCSLFGKR